jgi:hypothetical protein
LEASTERNKMNKAVEKEGEKAAHLEAQQKGKEGT